MTDSRSATMRRFEERVIASGEVIFPAVPALRSNIVLKLRSIFEGLNRPLGDDALAELDELLQQKLAEAFAAAPQSNVFVRYQLPRGSGPPTFAVASAKSSLEEEYDHWVSTRTGSLFGASADAMVLHVATEIGRGRALDVGAGAGRNTRALAQLGFDVVALELSPALADITRDELDREGVCAEVVCGDVFDERLELPVKDGFDFVVVAEVVPHLRSVEEFKALLERLRRWSTPQARVLVSAFVSDAGFDLDEASRQICQVQWSSCFTPEEVDGSIRDTGWSLVADESVLEFERRHQTQGTWPPTSWFISWCSGRDAFDMDEPPMELRWLLLSRA